MIQFEGMAPSGSSAQREPGTSFRRKMIFLAVVLVLGLAYLLRGVLVPLFLAFLLAYALDPFVDRLEALRVPRPLGAILVMLGIAGLVSVVLVYAVPLFVDEVRDASSALPDQIHHLQARKIGIYIFHTTVCGIARSPPGPKARRISYA